MKDEKLANRDEMEQDARDIQGNNLSSENLDMSELEGVEGGNLDTGCSAVFSGGCSSGNQHLAQDR